MLHDLERSAFDPADGYDVCIIGGGPVGLATADAAMRNGLRVIIVEAGSDLPQSRRNELNRGEVVGDDRFGAIEAKTQRVLGGTSWVWEIDLDGAAQGVRYTVIKPAVFDRRGIDGLREWPFDFDHLAPYYEQALTFLGLTVPVEQLTPRPAALVDDLEQGLYLFGDRNRFQARNLTSLIDATTVLLGANVVAMTPAGLGSETIDHVLVRSRNGNAATIRARHFVLAAGTVESTRLALLLGEHMPSVAANTAIGARLSDRPRISGILELDRDAPAGFEQFSMHSVTATDGRPVWGMHRWLTPAGHIAQGGTSCSFIPMPAPATSARRRRLECWAKRLLIILPSYCELPITDNAGRAVGRFMLWTSRHTYRLRSWIYRSVLRSQWDLEWARWTRNGWQRCRTWKVTAIVEQLPDPANRIELGDERDEFGNRRVRVVWGKPISRSGSVDTSLRLAAEAVQRAGLGRLRWDNEDFDSVSSCHMMGTLPIGDDEAVAALDRHGRLRGTSNVFAAGNCAFPTSGHANPTLTGIALGIRVADHLAAELRRTGTAAATGSSSAALD
jgi:choline dehydrogenase-like flavoprotein